MIWLFGITVLVSIIIISCIIITCEERHKKEKIDFNNGICKKCGTKLKLSKISGRTRYYVCPNCLRIIEVIHKDIDTDKDTGLYKSM